MYRHQLHASAADRFTTGRREDKSGTPCADANRYGDNRPGPTSDDNRHGAAGHGGRLLKAVFAGTAAALLLGFAAPQAGADEGSAAPPAPAAPSEATRGAAHDAAEAPKTLATLSRFFARDGAVTKAKAAPRVTGERAVPVYYVSPDFVAGKKGVPIARMQFLASTAVSSDGQKASLWTVKQSGSWQVVNIATGDDETRYARVGADKLPGGTVFHEPQINAWYVQKGTRILPLDRDAVRAVGTDGTTVAAYQRRVHKEYGDKLPGSAYAKSGKAGGFGAAPEAAGSQSGPATAAGTAAGSTDGAVTVVSSVAAAGAALALGLSGAALVRRRTRRLGRGPAA
ncbi:hypothetical protein GCM10018785_64590 [Streptomyces longispororuber]|uniref:Uncharacterized protein n=1 Tax=Streptomyces longispororuber TaxID=68230 RepID=A0A919A694_9ACTN|nr:hypothetical protein [Streptomyces longispororuber]GHE88247.1 hypothetical protein GCM10018785_64590 [Streptomyces longispororuber]